MEEAVLDFGSKLARDPLYDRVMVPAHFLVSRNAKADIAMRNEAAQIARVTNIAGAEA
jgi:hypothetical protein